MDRESILAEFTAIANVEDHEIDVATAAFLIAASEYPQMDIPYQLDFLNAIAKGAAAKFTPEREPLYCVNMLSEYLFDELKFRGNKDDYYDPRNSFLNEVLQRRLGIPISLSLVYIEVGKRLGFPLVGIGLPGHFVVRHRAVESLFIDPFNGGILKSKEECIEQVRTITNAEVQIDPRHFQPVSNREFIARMLRNLKATYLEKEDHKRALRVMDYLLALIPSAPRELRDRGLVYYQLGSYSEAMADLTGYVTSGAIGEDGQAVQEIMGKIRQHLGT